MVLLPLVVWGGGTYTWVSSVMRRTVAPPVAVRVSRVAVGLSTCRRGRPGTSGTVKAF